MKNKTRTFLVIDDDFDSCEMLQFMFKARGCEVIICQDSQEGIRLVRDGKFDAVILDYRMPELDGSDVCRAIRTFNKDVPIVFFSASAQKKEHQAILAAGAQAFLVKPNDLSILTETVIELAERTTSKVLL